MRILLIFAWLLAAIYGTIPAYWLVVHPRARRWALAGGLRVKRVGPFWMLLWAVAGGVTWHWRLRALYHAWWTVIPGVLLILGGLRLYRLARQEFSADQLLGRPELEPDKHEQALRTGGIRANIRHPIYLGHFCEMLGWAVITGSVVTYAMTAFAALTGYWMIRSEERELEQRFGKQYRDYQQRSAAMIPGVW